MRRVFDLVALTLDLAERLVVRAVLDDIGDLLPELLDKFVVGGFRVFYGVV